MHRIGTAGWSVPGKESKQESHLFRYSRTLSCVEVNSSFYRPHRIATWERWARETPPDFRFSVKAPKTITHDQRLRAAEPLLDSFFEQVRALGEKAGPVLFQLPPSLSFQAAIVEEFLSHLRNTFKGEVVLEPRHGTWFTEQVDKLLKRFSIARVAADPPKGSPAAAKPGGDIDLAYFRLHGSPTTYYSSYDSAYLIAMTAELKQFQNVWIVFDNTALSQAFPNAMKLQTLLTTG